ncbi:hypothetical protein Mterra_03138 [Calidithermus terrae]|uniref:Uncharacterized protein n=1 Tax=Calidithermus terrae TaxID=1408545 RepID=A0A399EBZ6_9DEIN|nr:hypothetical protein [Calidithermus terrae]RIH81468.1 hypothetical protein Mterra_03138 [Calidithermus terrae]
MRKAWLWTAALVVGSAWAQGWKVEEVLDPSTERTQVFVTLSASREGSTLPEGDLTLSCFDVEDPTFGGYIAIDFKPTGFLMGPTSARWRFDDAPEERHRVILRLYEGRSFFFVPEEDAAAFFEGLLGAAKLEVVLEQPFGRGVLRFDVSGLEAYAARLGCFQF